MTYDELKAFATEADRRGDRQAAMAAMKKMQAMGQVSQKGTIADALGQGVSMGFSDELAGALGAIPAAIHTGNWSLGEHYRGIRDAARANAEGFRERNPGTALAAEVGGGLLTGGLGATRALGGVAARNAANLIGRSTATGAGMGLLSGAGYSEADSVGGVAGDAAKGALAGGLLGAAFPAAGQALSRVKARTMAGRSTDPYRQAVGILEREGIPLTTAQKSGANWAKSAEQTLSEVPLGGKPLQTAMEDQKRAYQRKLFQMIGVDADMLTAESLERAGQHLSQEYADALKGRGIDLADDAFLDDLGRIESLHTRFVDDPTKGKVRSIVSEFIDEATKGPKSGEWYQQQRSLFAKRAMKTGETADLYGDLKHALDDAFARAAGSDVKGNLDARYAQYKQLQDLFNRVAGGPAGAEGFIPAGQLARMASQKPGTQEWKDLTRAAAAVLPDRLGNSGTAQRNMMLGMLGMGAFEPTSMIYGPLAARAISGQLAKGRSLDMLKLMPGGLLQDPRMLAPTANAGLLVSDPGRTSR